MCNIYNWGIGLVNQELEDKEVSTSIRFLSREVHSQALEIRMSFRLNIAEHPGLQRIQSLEFGMLVWIISNDRIIILPSGSSNLAIEKWH